MWYFAWILGVTLACTAAILNGIWLEMHLADEASRSAEPEQGS
ncbi:MAG: cytochrome bd-I oxidase subunit CydX [Rhodospirillales bacterium]|nr:cytochrome bd-I oxidase subunit CydX [Rhodospirillales bacterium]